MRSLPWIVRAAAAVERRVRDWLMRRRGQNHRMIGPWERIVRDREYAERLYALTRDELPFNLAHWLFKDLAVVSGDVPWLLENSRAKVEDLEARCRGCVAARECDATAKARGAMAEEDRDEKRAAAPMTRPDVASQL